MSYTPEHHPNCPCFESFKAGDGESTAPTCRCTECRECKGDGSIVYSAFQAGDQCVEEIEDCFGCDGLGRVML